ncbi:VanZ family protein [Antribacter gilvus]|uniref:VanZ family protein n=1 Tax=Antribacter gilvus TaxID=2304675 RepID=UPI000F7B9A6A|nr:VanZ family protein [Antribacter gilvus]
MWWGGVWARWGDVLAVVAVGLPLAVLLAVGLARWRVRRGTAPGWAWRASVGEVGIAVGTAPWLWMILTPTGGDGGLALVPLRDLVTVLAGSPGEALVQVGGNLLVLSALGLFLPVRFALGTRAAVGRGPAPAVLGEIALAAAGLSLLVELLQRVLDLGRVSSVDDVLLNTVGAVLGAVCSRRWWRTPHDLRRNPTD